MKAESSLWMAERLTPALEWRFAESKKPMEFGQYFRIPWMNARGL